MKFIHGCNYPWSTDGSTVFYGLDFGANVWGSHLGVSTRRGAIERDFADMASLGFTAVRWFLFCDGRSGIVYGADALPAGPDAHLFADIDTALEVAGSVGIRIDFVLFDFHWMFAGVRETIPDPVTGDLLEARLPDGRANILHSAEGRDALFEMLIAPLVRRYAPGGERADLAPHVLAYELMNEPDWIIEEWEKDLSPHVRRPLPFEILSEMVARLSDLVHRHSAALTTLGAARLRNLWAWDDDALGLDLLQVHVYPEAKQPGKDPGAFPPPPTGRPLLLGEFGGVPMEECLEQALAHGYAGAWPWSFSGTDRYGRLPEDGLRAFARRYPELVNSRFGI